MAKVMETSNRPSTLALGFLALLAACGASPASSVATDHPDGTAPTGVGACECSDDAFCEAQADTFLAEVSQPRHLDRHYVGAECVARDPHDSLRCCYSRPAVCLCYFAWGDTNARVPENALILGNRTTCDVDSRDQSCLYRSCEFAGCDPAVAASCDAACADVVARLAAHETETFEVERRKTYCDPKSCLCRGVYRIGDRCFAGRNPFARAYDCALDDDAIIAAESPPPNDNGSAMAIPINEDAGAPTCD